VREFLVTKFVCSECGRNLKLADDTPKGAGRHAEGEPTGFARVQQLVAIEPCECITQKLGAVSHAIDVLLQLKEPTR